MRMNSPVDNTTIIRMKRDFADFLTHTGSRRRKRGALELDKSICETLPICKRSTSVQSALDIEIERKQKDAEIIADKGQIAQLEIKVNMLETLNKKFKIEFSKDIKLSIQEKEQALEKLNDAKMRLKFLSKKENQVREEYDDYRKEVELKLAASEKQLQSLKKEKVQQEQKTQQVQDGTDEKMMELKKELFKRQSELQSCQCDLKEAQNKLTQQTQKLAENAAHVKELEEFERRALQADRQITDLQLKISRLEEDSVLAKVMKSQLSKLPQLEEEIQRLIDDNEYLREIQENTLLMKEQIQGLQMELNQAEQKYIDSTKMQLEYEELKKKLQEWKTLDGNETEHLLTPSGLRRRLSELQTAEAVLLEKNGQLQTIISSQEKETSSLNELCQGLRIDKLSLQSQQQQQAGLIRRLQKKLLLVTKERDGYKRIIDSYESEVTLSLDSHTSSHIQQLEDLLGSYRKQLEWQQTEMTEASENVAKMKTKCQELESLLQSGQQNTSATFSKICGTDQEIISQLRRRVEELEKENEEKVRQNNILEAKLEHLNLQGSYDPVKTKVVHFSMNPADLAQKERAEKVNKLMADNERLKHRLKLLEESGRHVEDLTLQVEEKMEEPSTSKEIEDIKAQLNTAELKNKRLLEAFKKTSQEFREVCFQLTGYRIDISSASKYKLTSKYSRSADDYLLFQQGTSGEIQMLETEYSKTLTEMIDLYLKKQDSIPAFLSSLTHNLFGERTLDL